MRECLRVDVAAGDRQAGRWIGCSILSLTPRGASPDNTGVRSFRADRAFGFAQQKGVCGCGVKIPRPWYIDCRLSLGAAPGLGDSVLCARAYIGRGGFGSSARLKFWTSSKRQNGFQRLSFRAGPPGPVARPVLAHCRVRLGSGWRPSRVRGPDGTPQTTCGECVHTHRTGQAHAHMPQPVVPGMWPRTDERRGLEANILRYTATRINVRVRTECKRRQGITGRHPSDILFK